MTVLFTTTLVIGERTVTLNSHDQESLLAWQGYATSNPQEALQLLSNAAINQLCTGWSGEGYGYVNSLHDERGNVKGYNGFVVQGPIVPQG